MPPKKTPVGKPVTSSTGPRSIQTFTVRPKGARRAVQATATKSTSSLSTDPSPAAGIALRAVNDIQDFESDFVSDPLPASQIPPDQVVEPAPEVIEMEHLLDDNCEMFTEVPRRGMGQNEMLREWLQNWGDVYLRELYARYCPPIQPAQCLCGSPSPAHYRCTDCLNPRNQCRECLIHSHRYLPTHRVEEWVGATWSKTTLSAIGLVLALGNHLEPCPRGHTQQFVLGDMTGLHRVNLVFCRCRHSAELAVQLLRYRIFPCSEESPSTGFTFQCLRFFHLATVDAKLSGSRFCSLLQRSTNNILPQNNINRFRKFVRAAREWMFLQDQKRVGRMRVSSRGDYTLALRCPACPQLNINYVVQDVRPGEEYAFWQLINYDGTFQLVRKNKPFDEYDVCLSDGAKYWVNLEAFKKHLLANQDTAYAQSTRGSNCNNHRAANDTWVRHTGVAESGLGAVTCARHSFYLPNGTVAYYKGERFANTDFAIASVISLLMQEGATAVGVFYDIYCHWSKFFWNRAPMIALPSGPVRKPDTFFGGIGKYHQAGHTDGCYAQYSLNNMYGVGRLDAEGCERAWADLNQASGSTSERGPGSRYDALNHCMQDWNWRKTIGIVSLLLSKWEDANRMAREQTELWTAFHRSLDSKLTSSWEQMSIEPELVNGTWKSVFLRTETSATSMHKKLLELNKLESLRYSTSEDEEPGYTAPSWVLDGINLEVQQQRIIEDLKDYGRRPTDKQTLDLFRARSTLSAKILKHRSHASSLAEETDGQPELASLYLPSHLGPRLQQSDRSTHLQALELQLRRVACMRALQTLRTVTMYKARTTITKERQARGERINTRGHSILARATDQQKFAIWEYERSRGALLKVGATNDDKLKFRALTFSELSGVISILRGDREVGEGTRQLPWFFRLPSADSSAESVSAEEELNEAMRVEWFRGRERFKRWEEEKIWLRREMASVIYSFKSTADSWSSRSATEDLYLPGYSQYAIRQHDSWITMHKDALKRCYPLMLLEPQLAICARICEEFPLTEPASTC